MAHPRVTKMEQPKAVTYEKRNLRITQIPLNSF